MAGNARKKCHRQAKISVIEPVSARLLQRRHQLIVAFPVALVETDRRCRQTGVPDRTLQRFQRYTFTVRPS